MILLSGMGADERVFAAQRQAIPNLSVPKWLANDAAFLRWASRAADAELVPGAGHALSLSHPLAITAFLMRHMQNIRA